MKAKRYTWSYNGFLTSQHNWFCAFEILLVNIGIITSIHTISDIEDSENFCEKYKIR